VRYPFNQQDPTGPKRTKESYSKDVELCEQADDSKFSSNGVKGACLLNSCRYYHTTHSTNIDYMHSVLEGVAYSLFEFWFEKASPDYSLKDQKEAINKILMDIRPPSYVANPPKPVDTYKLWKANDFLSFFLFYALIVFRGRMKDKLYNHITLFVIALEFLLSPRIKKQELDTIQNIMEEFVRNFGKLYDETAYSSGTHELLHLVECSRKFGPLNLCNSFPFEELNRKIASMIFGKDLMGEEFIKLYSSAQALSFFNSRVKFTNDSLNEFFTKTFFIKTSNRKKFGSSEGLVIKCDTSSETNNFFSQLLIENGFFVSGQLKTLGPCYFNGICYTDTRNSSRFADFCVFDTKKKKYGLIQRLVVYEKNVLTINQQILDCLPIQIRPGIKSKTLTCRKITSYFVSSIENLEKCFFFDYNETICFISTFRTSHLFS
jgi:hypothetical protein